MRFELVQLIGCFHSLLSISSSIYWQFGLVIFVTFVYCSALCAVQEGRGGFSAAWGCRCCLNFVLTSNICIHFLATMDLAFAFTSSLVVGTGVQFVSYINQDWFCPNGGKDYKPCPPCVELCCTWSLVQYLLQCSSYAWMHSHNA